MYDYLIVGAGLFGSTFARQATDAGRSCLVIDKRSHIAGNCYTENVRGVDVHRFGPHIFHTNNNKIWTYINQFAEFNSYTHRAKVNYDNKIFSFPINLFTLNQLWGVTTPLEASQRLESVRVKIDNPQNLEEWALSQLGEEIYDIFIRGYTKKQWNKDPKDLPASIIKRLPIRLTHDDNYFNDEHQGIPIGGYTKVFEKILDGIPLGLGTDYLADREYYDGTAKKVVYTGPIDEFFNNEYGVLEWRSLRFEHESISDCDFQGTSIVNFIKEDVPYTRIVEHKHFDFRGQKNTVVTKEYPQDWTSKSEKFYPINDEKNQSLYERYKKLIPPKFIFGGRLAEYRYYDMHQVIASALKKSHEELGNE